MQPCEVCGAYECDHFDLGKDQDGYTIIVPWKANDPRAESEKF